MAASSLKKLFEYILPKGKNRAGGVSYTDTFDPSNTTKTLDMPQYQQHLTDIADSRLTDNSQDLVKTLMIADPDMASATSAYLTLADTPLNYVVRDSAGEISRDGQKLLQSLLYRVFDPTDQISI